ncbi:MAG: hypothetical protein ACOY4I_05715 [Bacillota bacterium]
MGMKIFIALAVAFSAAMVGMLVSGTARDITLATTKFDNLGESHH